MCGRYMVTSPPEAMRRLFGAYGFPNFPPRYNVAPTQDVPAVYADSGKRTLGLMRWGLVSPGTPAGKEGKPGVAKPLINARGENVATAAPFRDAFKHRRCLVPANGYYEWAQEDKAPYLFRRPDHEPFAFAGIWERWRRPDAPDALSLLSCAIITTRASPLVAPLHDRMPVILPEAAWAAWLGETGAAEIALRELVRHGGDEGFTATRVSKRVNSHLNDDPACIEEARDDEPPPAAHASGRLL